MRITELEPVFVAVIPDQLEQGKLYISRKYTTATHLCCCGCGHKVVTPFGQFNPYGWTMTESDGKVSFLPSIYNVAYKCKSHYFIKDNKVIWC